MSRDEVFKIPPDPIPIPTARKESRPKKSWQNFVPPDPVPIPTPNKKSRPTNRDPIRPDLSRLWNYNTIWVQTNKPEHYFIKIQHAEAHILHSVCLFFSQFSDFLRSHWLTVLKILEMCEPRTRVGIDSQKKKSQSRLRKIPPSTIPIPTWRKKSRPRKSRQEIVPSRSKPSWRGRDWENPDLTGIPTHLYLTPT